MNRYIKEVIDVHADIENWLGKGEGDLGALLSRFSARFSMVTVAGGRLDAAGLGAFFNQQRGAKPGLNIELEEITVIEEWPNGAVVSYGERQSQPGEKGTLRYSTVIFSAEMQWLRLHETAA